MKDVVFRAYGDKIMRVTCVGAGATGVSGTTSTAGAACGATSATGANCTNGEPNANSANATLPDDAANPMLSFAADLKQTPLCVERVTILMLVPAVWAGGRKDSASSVKKVTIQL